LDYFQYKLKGISFLPYVPLHYKQLPYEEISEENYKQKTSKLKPIDWKKLKEQPRDPIADKFCQGDTCNIQLNL
jgi:hypothetical protein